jgi:hypothetical protein
MGKQAGKPAPAHPEHPEMLQPHCPAPRVPIELLSNTNL